MQLERGMRFELFTLAIFVCLNLVGCGTSTPGCGDKETLDLVKEIASRELSAPGRLMRGRTIEVSAAEIELSYVSIVAHDKELDIYSCSANLDWKELSLPIQFDVRPSATDPDQFVVQVAGLR